MADTARMEPTERSIPPVRITKVIPVASTVLIDASCATTGRLFDVRKRPAAKLNVPVSPIGAQKLEQDRQQDQHRQHAGGLHERTHALLGEDGGA